MLERVGGSFARKYSDAQRDAIAAAWASGIRPAERISELAASGRLEPYLEPFEVPPHTVRSTGARALRRSEAARAGLQNAPDALELVRRRLLAALELELARIDASQRSRRPPKDLPARIRETARAAREIAALQGGAAQPSGASSRTVNAPRSRAGGMAAAIVRANELGAASALAPAQELEPELSQPAQLASRRP
jgi:hypothetical protein